MTGTLQLICGQCDAVNRLPAARLRDRPRCGACKQPIFAGRPMVLDTASFDLHLRRDDLPLVVDFWASWCGPCRAMAPAFQAAATRLEPAVRLAKVDTEAEPALAARYDVRSVPTLIIFRAGREIARTAGAMSLESLVGWVRASTGQADN